MITCDGEVLAEVAQHEGKRAVGVSGKIVHVASNPLEEKEDPSGTNSIDGRPRDRNVPHVVAIIAQYSTASSSAKI